MNQQQSSNDENSTAIVPRGETSMETASSAQASQAQAMVQARFAIAYKRPRNIDDVRTGLLAECKRPGFAAVARYCRPVGKTKNEQGEWVDSFAEGPSIRFAEQAARSMTNISYGAFTIFDDAEKRIVRVFALDLESNVGGEKDITIAKTKERRKLKQGEQALATRRNSYGDLVYIIAMQDSELPVKEAAETSKQLRTLLLRLVPGWIIDECEDQIFITLQDKDAKDPEAARRSLVDAFAAIGVKAADLAGFLKHDLAASSPAEMARLRAIYATIKDGEATWLQITELPTDEEKPKDSKLAAVANKVQARIAKIQEAKQKRAPAPAEQKPVDAPSSEPEKPAEVVTSPAAREPGSDG